MSVIQSIKGALNNVQQVGSSGIKSLKKKTNRPKTYPGVEGVDLDAGADLLNKFQQQWAEMHERSEQNARAAQKVDITLRAQYDRCERQTEAMNQLMSLVSGLPHLLTDITKLVDKISAIEEQFQQVEDDLVMLTDISEAAEMKANQLHHHHQLAVYKQRRARDLEQVKVQLANEHAKKVEGYEAKLQEHLRVKQEAFEEAFAREMQHYKQYGSTDMRPLLTQSPQCVELADISIEQDHSALNAFLESDEGNSESTTETITVEEDDDDEDSYVNIGIVSTNLSDPELEDRQNETETGPPMAKTPTETATQDRDIAANSHKVSENKNEISDTAQQQQENTDSGHVEKDQIIPADDGKESVEKEGLKD